MKKALYMSLISCIALGCSSESKLVFEPHQMEWELCERCPRVEVNIPRAINTTAAARAINNTLEEAVISLLPFKKQESMPDMATDSVAVPTEEIADEKINWESEITGEIVYEDSNIVTAMLSAYTYTGGVQGHSYTTYLNFTKEEGRKLENQQLFDNLEEFKEFVEAQFRQQQNIAPMADINTMGFKFKNSTFYLPEYIGYTSEGLQLIYNPQEVASYEEDPIVLRLPYTAVNRYLRWEVPVE